MGLCLPQEPHSAKKAVLDMFNKGLAKYPGSEDDKTGTQGQRNTFKGKITSG